MKIIQRNHWFWLQWRWWYSKRHRCAYPLNDANRWSNCSSSRRTPFGAIQCTYSHDPIRFKLLETAEGLTRYSCTGTPTDCVKLALNEILDRKPDLLVSGINHGSNAAINVIYSGTMGAVLEGCENGILSIEPTTTIRCQPILNISANILQITRTALANGLPEGICLNVNSPKDEIKGVRVCRQCVDIATKEFCQTNRSARTFLFLAYRSFRESRARSSGYRRMGFWPMAMFRWFLQK